jgi:hypothetical protein
MMASMSDAPKRNWFRFSLRNFLAVIAVIALWLGWGTYKAHQREQIAQFIRNQYGGGFTYGPPLRPWKQLPLTLRILGVKSVQRIDAQGIRNEDDRKEIQSAFPEADIYF